MFGASLNPVTLAHVAIVQALLDEKWNAHVRENLCGAGNSLCDSEAPDNDAPLFDEVWVLPVYSHPDVEKYKHIQHIKNRTPEQDELLDIYRKKKELHDSFNDRVRLCQVRWHRILWSLSTQLKLKRVPVAGCFRGSPTCQGQDIRT